MTSQARGRLAAVVLTLALSIGTAVPTFTVRAQEGCPDGVAPAFEGGVAGLDALMPGVLGLPLRCGFEASAAGVLLQPTTRGLAYYHPDLNRPGFWDGGEHWAFTDHGLQCWRGDLLDPPPEPPGPFTRFAPVDLQEAPDPLGAEEGVVRRFTPAPFDISAEAVLAALDERCLPIRSPQPYTPETDPSGLLGAPGGYLSSVYFEDGRVTAAAPPCEGDECAVPEGGSVEVFFTELLAVRREQQVGGLRVGNVLLRLPTQLGEAEVGWYRLSLQDTLGG